MLVCGNGEMLLCRWLLLVLFIKWMIDPRTAIRRRRNETNAQYTARVQTHLRALYYNSNGQNGYSLASWVKIQRSVCYNLADKEKFKQDGSLDLIRLGSEQAKLVKLNCLGFEWDKQWVGMYDFFLKTWIEATIREWLSAQKNAALNDAQGFSKEYHPRCISSLSPALFHKTTNNRKLKVLASSDEARRTSTTTTTITTIFSVARTVVLCFGTLTARIPL